MKNVYIVKRERVGLTSLVLRTVKKKQVFIELIVKTLAVNIFFVLTWALYLVAVIWLFFLTKQYNDGMTMFQDMVINSREGEWFSFIFGFGLSMILGQGLWVLFVVEPLTKLFQCVINHRLYYIGDSGSFYKSVKICRNGRFGIYTNCPELSEKERNIEYIYVDTLFDKLEDWFEEY